MQTIFNFAEEQKPIVYSINNLGELNKQFNIQGQRGKWILNSDENNPTLNYYIIRNLTKENIDDKSDDSDDKNKRSKTWIWIVVSLIIVIALGVGVLLFFRYRKKKKMWGLDNKFL